MAFPSGDGIPSLYVPNMDETVLTTRCNVLGVRREGYPQGFLRVLILVGRESGDWVRLPGVHHFGHFVGTSE